MSGWRTANVTWLAARLDVLRLRFNRRALWLRQPLGDRAPSGDWLLSGEAARAERRFYAADAEAREWSRLLGARTAAVAELEERMRADGHVPALRALGLPPLDEDMLLLAAAPGLDAAFGRACAELHGEPGRRWPTPHLGLGLLLDDDDPAVRLLGADCLLPDGPLRALRLIDVDDAAEPLLNRRLSVDERVTGHLRGADRADERLVPLLQPIEPGVPGAGDAAAAVVVELITAAPGTWSTINLVGTPDSGAREAAARAAAELSSHLVALDLAGLAARPPAERAGIVALLGREAVLSRLAMLVDTTGIEPGEAAAAVVDELIERLAAPLFVVSRERWGGAGPAHRAVRVVAVTAPTRTEQVGLWRAALAAHENRVNGEVDAIVQQFDLGPAAIAAVVADAGRDAADGSVDGAALWTSCRRQAGAALGDLARRLAPAYGWDDIVLPPDVLAGLREMAAQVAHRGRVYERWGFGHGRGRGISALFAGPSGTGKTMAAEILAAHLDLELFRIDLSGVVSKYIGETEKNLRRVFDAAEAGGAILFFDEADALFGTRTEVRDSHDRYANIEVNYLLQRMEDYTGLAVLATNRRDALDDAFLRRLRFVVTFPFPSAADRRRIWSRVFPARAEVAELDFAFLSRLEVSGGNIRSIAVNAAFLAAAAGQPIGMEHVVRAAGREYAKLGRPIGAAEFGAYLPVAVP